MTAPIPTRVARLAESLKTLTNKMTSCAPVQAQDAAFGSLSEDDWDAVAESMAGIMATAAEYLAEAGYDTDDVQEMAGAIGSQTRHMRARRT